MEKGCKIKVEERQDDGKKTIKYMTWINPFIKDVFIFGINIYSIVSCFLKILMIDQKENSFQSGLLQLLFPD